MRDNHLTKSSPSNTNAANKLERLGKLYSCVTGAEVYKSNISARNKALYSFAVLLPLGTAELAWLKAEWYVHVLYIGSVLCLAMIAAHDRRNGKYKD